MNTEQHAQAETQSTTAPEEGVITQQSPLYTVKQYAKPRGPHTEPALRNLIFKATPRKSTLGDIPGNGLIECGAIIRVGRKILIDDPKFIDWMRRQVGGE